MKLVLIDGNSLINRAYYAMPSLTDNKGRSTGGLYGFASMLYRLISKEKPTHMAVAFDLKAPTHRHQKYPLYKAQRKPMPNELAEQLPLLKALLNAMNIMCVEKEGYEADDIVGTLSKIFDIPTVIVSGDKDCLQLIDNKTTVLYTRRGITDVIEYTPQRLLEDGLTPAQVTDLKGLMGDTSDNIPGVPGVGEKTAKQLLADYGSIDNIYEHIDEQKGKLKEKLEENKALAYFSKELATITRDMECNLTLDALEFRYPFGADAEKMMRDFNFRTLIDRFEFCSADASVELLGEVVFIDERSEFDRVLQGIEGQRFAYRLGEELIFSFCTDTEYRVTLKADLTSGDIGYDYALKSILSVLNDQSYTKIAFDVKIDYHTVGQTYPAEDVMLMSYVLDAGHNWSSLEEMLKYYGYSGARPAAEMLSLFEELKSRLTSRGILSVYQEIEKPLVKVLYDMEKTGFRVDIAALRELERKFTLELNTLTSDIYMFAKRQFNINSPKQLGTVLFDELKLPSDKKKSTGADKLNFLADKHPIIPLLLRYRELSKLLSTYITNLPLDADGRLRTVFKQAVTTTGRLSSTEPNLQNIPIRRADGREIRRAFIASDGNVLISADYSQIELRLMAHYSKDKELIKAYIENRDIHTATAAKVFGVLEIEVTDEMRRRAKAVNFGIIYGISDFGLSESIKTSIAEAKSFIEKYFETYPAVKRYMDESKKTALENGYATTLFGRVRYIPELKSGNYNVRSFGERAAMNMPLQGSASDIIKIAMKNVYAALIEQGLRAKLILQVHDELIVDSPLEEVEKVKSLLKSEMESVIKLAVPLIVDVGSGANWMEAK